MIPYRTLLIVAAMDEEERALVEVLGASGAKPRPTSRRLGIEVREFARGDRRFLVARSGIGAVNAALAVAFAAESEPLDGILLLGVGGAIVEGLEIGDLVVATSVLQHDSYASLDGGDVRMKAGSLLFTGTPAEEVEHRCDPGFREWVTRSIAGPYRSGAVLSGAEFVGTRERKRAIAHLHPEALLVEMEGCGVAQVAERLGVPFVVAKTVADRLLPDGSIEQDFRTCLSRASANAGLVLAGLLER